MRFHWDPTPEKSDHIERILASIRKESEEKTKKIAESLPDSVPLAWCHEFEGARSFYTALGHKKEYYSDPNFRKHLLGGIQWAMGK